jgi:hypothetical protein
VPEFKTILATIVGKILYLCHSTWHEPTERVGLQSHALEELPPFLSALVKKVSRSYRQRLTLNPRWLGILHPFDVNARRKSAEQTGIALVHRTGMLTDGPAIQALVS